MSLPTPRPRAPFVLAAVPLTLSLLVACGDDDTTGGSISPDDPSAGSSFADSDAFTERYATRTEGVEPDIDAATLDALVDALDDFSLDLHRAVAAADPTAGTVTSVPWHASPPPPSHPARASITAIVQ